MTIIIMFPENPNPGVGDMNYTCVVQGASRCFSFFFAWPGCNMIGGVLALATIYYFLPKYGGMHWFKGPVVTVSREDIAPNVLEGREKDEVEVPSLKGQ